jgi:hypothetical protein
MKLLRIKLPKNLKEPFRSLHPGFEIFFYPDFNSKFIEPVGLAGLNGSGKSNLLELVSEIFYFLDGQHLEFKTESIKEDKSLGFEIEYAIPFTQDNPNIKYDGNPQFTSDDKYLIVRIIKKVGRKPEYSITSEKNYFDEINIIRHSIVQIIKEKKDQWKYLGSNPKDIAKLLPNKIFAYTSGQNELLSNCYYKMQFFYFNDYKNRIKQGSAFYIDSSRLFFCDNKSHTSIFISNYLLASKKSLSQLNDVVQVKELFSFRITIRFSDEKGKEILFSYDLKNKINRLINCATSWIENGTGAKKILTIDFLVNDATKNAFKKTFGSSPFDLYKIFLSLKCRTFTQCLKVF